MSLSTKSTRIVLAAAAGALALTTGCSSSTKPGTAAGAGNTSPTSPNSSTSSGMTAAISLRSGVIVGSDGKTLYYNTLDTATKITCTGACASIWPPVTGRPVADTGLASTDFSTATRPDGTTQVTYFGHPLYHFSADAAPGDKKGEGISDAGGKWIAANPSQAAGIPASSPPVTTSSAPGGYGGY